MITTKRWNDPLALEDGYRLLVCRYRPRGVSGDQETWDAWLPQLGPSKELHAAAYGKSAPPIPWAEYAKRYLREMTAQGFWIRGFAEREAKGESMTLLCSSACVDAARCHRTLLRELILRANEPVLARSIRTVLRTSRSVERSPTPPETLATIAKSAR